MAMKVAGILGVMAMVGLPAQHVMCDEANGMVVRIALLEIDPAQLVAYQHAVKEEITESIRKSAPLFRDLCQRRRLPKPHRVITFPKIFSRHQVDDREQAIDRNPTNTTQCTGPQPPRLV